MILGVSGFAVFSGGVSAVFGPEMAPVLLAVASGAVVIGSRQPGWRRVFVAAAVFAFVVAGVWLRADLVPPARFSRWLALVPLLGLVEIRRLRMGWEDWMAPAVGICTAGLVLFWRMDRYGRVLASLRGDWQEPLSYSPRWLYHLGTGLALGVFFILFARLVGCLPSRYRNPLAWVVLGVALACVVFDLIAPAQRWLLLHGPPTRVG